MSFLSNEQIISNIEALKKWLRSHKLDALYLSSFDTYLNEYVPLKDCHRYYVTGFTGSVAESLVLSDGRVLLFVDGRYHEQADKQVPLDHVEVVKCQMGESLEKRLLKEVKERNLKKIAFEGDRCRYQFQMDLSKKCEVKPLDNNELLAIVDFDSVAFNAPIESIPEKLCQYSTTQKIKKLLKAGESQYVTALDEIAWLANARSYGIAYQSTFASKALCVHSVEGDVRLVLFLTSQQKPNEEMEQREDIHFIHCYDSEKNNIDLFQSHLESLSQKLQLQTVFFDEKNISSKDYRLLKGTFDQKLKACQQRVNDIQTVKTEEEVESFRSAFSKASEVISKTFLWAVDEVSKGSKVSEFDFKEKLESEYREKGARSQSFSTIAGFKDNGSIIHYSNPSKDVILENGSLLLCDSGAFFEGGLATDCTRTVHMGGEVSERQKRLYTLVLKGLLKAQHAVFPENTIGSQIDSLAREPLRLDGLDYAHGTGHGVGVNVHESGFRLSNISTIKIKEGQVGSIEPGVYIPGELGIRLENIVVVKKHSRFKGMLCFEPLNYVGYDHRLIDLELLSKDEIKWLNEYEEICEKNGTSMKSLG